MTFAEIGLLQWLIAAVAIQRLAELIVAKRNTARLLSAGATESGAGHYKYIVLLHGAWLAAIFVFVPADAPPVWLLVAVFAVLQAGRIWVIASLGRYWTTRIITLPGAPLVQRGPYRFIRHPNYLIVCLEIVILPLAFGAWELAAIFGAANIAMLAWRIRIENPTLERRRGTNLRSPNEA